MIVDFVIVQPCRLCLSPSSSSGSSCSLSSRCSEAHSNSPLRHLFHLLQLNIWVPRILMPYLPGTNLLVGAVALWRGEHEGPHHLPGLPLPCWDLQPVLLPQGISISISIISLVYPCLVEIFNQYFSRKVLVLVLSPLSTPALLRFSTSTSLARY